MKTMLTAFVAVFVIAFAANVILGGIGFASADRYTSAAVRLDH